jgi:phenylalanine-4-hydroxylase
MDTAALQPAPAAGGLGAHTTHDLRGDYSAMRPDWTVDQRAHVYSDQDRATWATLAARQGQIVRRYADRAFLDGLETLGDLTRIPDLEAVSDRLEAQTGWRLVAVPGFIPDEAFFAHLAARRFPTCVWVRRPDEIDYLVEPDLFHDFFGHVPLLTQPAFAENLRVYGEKGLAAGAEGALSRLARFYWYMVEFGLIETPQGLKVYGAGILSSAAECRHAIESPEPLRVRFDLARVLRTSYRIDDFQPTYFVIRSYAELFEALNAPIRPVVKAIEGLPDLAPTALHPGDVTVPAGRAMAEGSPS